MKLVSGSSCLLFKWNYFKILAEFCQDFMHFPGLKRVFSVLRESQRNLRKCKQLRWIHFLSVSLAFSQHRKTTFFGRENAWNLSKSAAILENVHFHRRIVHSAYQVDLLPLLGGGEMRKRRKVLSLPSFKDKTHWKIILNANVKLEMLESWNFACQNILEK